jgi:hypothetical protein
MFGMLAGGCQLFGSARGPPNGAADAWLRGAATPGAIGVDTPGGGPVLDAVSVICAAQFQAALLLPIPGGGMPGGEPP